MYLPRRCTSGVPFQSLNVSVAGSLYLSATELRLELARDSAPAKGGVPARGGWEHNLVTSRQVSSRFSPDDF